MIVWRVGGATPKDERPDVVKGCEIGSVMRSDRVTEVGTNIVTFLDTRGLTEEIRAHSQR